jgi:hypothetical protein
MGIVAERSELVVLFLISEPYSEVVNPIVIGGICGRVQILVVPKATRERLMGDSQ